uniref:Uncharacterized protein n=1 Tax=Trichobilharzia regenti TaxID=157069 RepID=A0AA85JHN2_TRIRE|nr:unnamed protein product [Trichobilharzia regenti]
MEVLTSLSEPINKTFDRHSENVELGERARRNEDRKRFYIKVLILFLIQLCIMIFVFFTFHYISVIKQWIGGHLWLMYFLGLVNGYNVIILLRVPTIERFFPFNAITLSIFALFHSIIVAQLTSETDAFTKSLSFFFILITSTVIFVFTTRYSHDITDYFDQYFYVFTIPLVLMPAFIVVFAVKGFEIMLTKVFMAFASIHFLFFLSITAQTLQGGHSIEVDQQDYVLGSMQIFTEIICSSLSVTALSDGSTSSEYYWFTTIFLIFNIQLAYFFILASHPTLTIIIIWCCFNAFEFNSNDKNTKWVETTKNMAVALKIIKKSIKIIIKMVPKNTKKIIKSDQVQGNALVHHHRKQQDYIYNKLIHEIEITTKAKINSTKD